jgi:hypothetical protein
LEEDFARIRRDFLLPCRALPNILYVKLIVFVAEIYARTTAMRNLDARMTKPALEAHWLLRYERATVLNTNAVTGFITSDNPVTFFEAAVYNLPPLHGTPALKYASTETTMPISPQQMLLLSRGSPGISYIDIPDPLVAELNRRTRAYCENHFVVSQDYLDPYWLELGTPPSEEEGKQE